MTFGIFLSIIAIHLAAAVSPGPSFVVALRTAASEGFAVACALAFGFGCGAVLWAAGAVAGIAVLFELVPALFTSLKLIGAAFLLFLGLMMWRHATDPFEEPDADIPPRSPKSAIRLGVSTFVANPKTAIFFGAVFVGLVPADTSLAWKAIILLAVFINETIWYIIVAGIFSRAPARAAYIRAKAWIDRGFGTLIALFGLKIATS